MRSAVVLAGGLSVGKLPPAYLETKERVFRSPMGRWPDGLVRKMVRDSVRVGVGDVVRDMVGIWLRIW